MYLYVFIVFTRTRREILYYYCTGALMYNCRRRGRKRTATNAHNVPTKTRGPVQRIHNNVHRTYTTPRIHNIKYANPLLCTIHEIQYGTYNVCILCAYSCRSRTIWCTIHATVCQSGLTLLCDRALYNRTVTNWRGKYNNINLPVYAYYVKY